MSAMECSLTFQMKRSQSACGKVKQRICNTISEILSFLYVQSFVVFKSKRGHVFQLEFIRFWENGPFHWI